MLAYQSRAIGASRAVIAGLALLAMTACGGGSGSSGTSPVPNSGYCGNDTQYLLAKPQSGGNISTAGQSFEIVVNGNNNQIAQSFQNFQLVLVPQNNSSGGVTTGPFSRTSDNNGFHPFTTDFYYSAQLQSNLQFGQTYNVYVNAFTSNCTPIGPIGQLYT
jgi:hypothetical protein